MNTHLKQSESLQQLHLTSESNDHSQRQVQLEIVRRLLPSPNIDSTLIQTLKIQVCRELEAGKIPRNSDLLNLQANLDPKISKILRKKPVRSLSGVAVVAVMAKPWTCPHGKCTYCPGGPETGIPRAYTGQEPLAMRAVESRFDPYVQVASRITQLQSMGHFVDKIELIIAGGTFPFLPRTYQEQFVARCLDALNASDSIDLEEAKRKAEEIPPIRNVGITIETRPDWSRKGHVDHMLSLGTTRVELGVQNIYDDIYARINRQHTVRDVVEATQVLKDSALKVGYHMMPGLPGSNPQRDIEGFRRVFEDPDFKPDMLKIYPCLVIPDTQLFEEWKRGEFEPYNTGTLAEMLSEVKAITPPWVRIMRIQREIPAKDIAAGSRNGNLRQFVLRAMKRKGVRCHCIRCREVGLRQAMSGVPSMPSQVSLKTISYEASGGLEIFLSFEDVENDILIAYLRMRIPSSGSHRPEIKSSRTALVRELHVLGQTVPVGKRLEESFQHRSFGSKLLKVAEAIARQDYDCRKMIIISALGTKSYYSRFGYTNEGPYVSKQPLHS